MSGEDKLPKRTPSKTLSGLFELLTTHRDFLPPPPQILLCRKQRLMRAMLGKTDNGSYHARSQFSRKFSFKIQKVKSNIYHRNSREKSVQKLSQVARTQYYSKFWV